VIDSTRQATTAGSAPQEARGDTPTGDSPKGDTPKGESRRFGNTNAIRHGLTCGKLPPNCQHIEIKINGLRRTLEAAVVAAKGEVGLVDAACIQTACKWERHGALALRWLVKAGDTLKPTDRLTFSREIARASAERDKALQALGLDQPDDDRPWIIPTDAGTDLEDK
jgi:hypothetical protein